MCYENSFRNNNLQSLGTHWHQHLQNVIDKNKFVEISKFVMIKIFDECQNHCLVISMNEQWFIGCKWFLELVHVDVLAGRG